jgi:hypothetical protein
MIDPLSTKKKEGNLSIKYLFFTIFVCISMVAWLGISDLRADEDDLEDNKYENEEGYQNSAQKQHIENIAKAAALLDLNKEGGQNEAFYISEIERMRSEGMGLGQIVHALNLNRDPKLKIHPSVLGLRHSPVSSEELVPMPMHSSVQSGKNHSRGLALGHSKDNSNNRGGGRNGGGRGGGKGGGKK